MSVRADLLLRGGPVFDRPGADALAVAGGRILAVGSAAALEPLSGPSTTLIELRGRPVWPGLIDSHVHLNLYSQGRRACALDSAQSIGDLVRLVAERARSLEPGAWLVERGWLRDRLERWPLAGDLDQAAPDRPVALVSHDSHALCVNSVVLRRAGIDATTPDPPGGVIGRLGGAAGQQPDGLLFETAQEPVYRLIPRPTLTERAAALRSGIREANKLGLTRIVNFEDRTALSLLGALRDSGDLTLRVTAGLGRDELEDDDWGALYGGDDLLTVGLIKLFADGALGSRTAYLLEPYLEQGGTGVARLSAASVAEVTRRARARGLGVAVHAIGDGGVRVVLDGFEQARADHSPAAADQVLRIEHAQLIDPADLPRFHRLGVVASMQPNHLSTDRPVAELEWGPRCAYAYPWASVVRSGALLALGTDAPVESLDPLRNLRVALSRPGSGDGQASPWRPSERLSLVVAVRAYSNGSARAAGLGKLAGTLTPGLPADLIILSTPPTTSPLDWLTSVGVDLTMVGGRIVHQVD